MKTILNLLLVISLLAVTQFSSAQTWTQTFAPSNNWDCIALSADGSKLIAITAGTNWVSTDSGLTWVSNNMPTTAVFWASLASSADGNKLAVARGDYLSPIYTSTDSGTTWTSNNIVAFWAGVASSADGEKLIAVSHYSDIFNGTRAAVWTSTNAGLNWVSNNVPGNTYYSAASSADGTTLVAGSASGALFVSTNSGLSWQTTILPTTNSLEAVTSSADGTKLVAAAYKGPIFSSTNSGTTWITNNAPNGLWTDVASSADGTKLLANGTWYVFDSTNTGTTWTSNGVYSVYYSGAISADGNKLVTCNNGDGRIYTSYTTPAPQLSLMPSLTNLAVSWLVPSTNFVLQQSSDLSSWVSVKDTPTLNLTNLQEQVILSPTNDNSFYRLATP